MPRTALDWCVALATLTPAACWASLGRVHPGLTYMVKCSSVLSPLAVQVELQLVQ